MHYFPKIGQPLDQSYTKDPPSDKAPTVQKVFQNYRIFIYEQTVIF